MVTAAPAAFVPRVRWSWLSSARADVLWNLAPFWAGYLIAAFLWAARDKGGIADNAALNFTLGGHAIHLGLFAFILYGPLVDAPHLWATIARTYTDPEEWAARRRLFLGSFVWLLIGPAVILLPYAVTAIAHLPAGAASIGWVAWGYFFTFYALFHVNKQHWGFVALYKRKNGDLANPLENKVDELFFYVSIWIPYVGWMTAPWFRDPDGAPLAWAQASFGGATIGGVLHPLCHVAFLAVCLAYVGFQLAQWRRGLPRNGPKLVYLATIIPLQYVAFMIHPFVAAFWIITTGLGHCAQYHRVVWTYGEKKYAAPAAKSLPGRIFSNVWLYIGLGLAFGVLSLQGPGAGAVKNVIAQALDGAVFRHLFTFLDRHEGVSLGLKVAAAFISGVRLHHFYVDSKIWKVSKNQALAKNLNV